MERLLIGGKLSGLVAGLYCLYIVENGDARKTNT